MNNLKPMGSCPWVQGRPDKPLTNLKSIFITICLFNAYCDLDIKSRLSKTIMHFFLILLKYASLIKICLC